MKIILFLAIFFSVIFSIFIWEKTQIGRSSEDFSMIVTSPRDSQSQFFGLPQALMIPKIGVQSNIQHVGLTSYGAMEIPSGKYGGDKWNDVAWFRLGVKPGNAGNAVIAGHLNTNIGTPAVFADLHKLETGDNVFVADEKGKVLRFRVFDKKIYDYRHSPMEVIFGSDGQARLNFITCDGVWLKDEKNYSQRLVIFSELIH